MYRNCYQITEDILDSISQQGVEGTTITPLIREANLSHGRILGFINKLTESNLINKIEVRGKTVFIITQRGKVYLEEYKKFSNIAENFGLEL
jgi:predicted transcriptional regulator